MCICGTILQKNPRLGENFDPIFTKGRTTLTPPDKNAAMILSNLNGSEFPCFSFCNPHFEPMVGDDVVIPVPGFDDLSMKTNSSPLRPVTPTPAVI